MEEFRENHVFLLFNVYICILVILTCTVGCRIARRVVWCHFQSKMEVWIKSYARKTGFPGIYSENWREKQVFPDLRANERENRKSKKNHLREIQRAFE